MSSSPHKLVKSLDIKPPSPLGRLRTKSFYYQLDLDSDLALLIKSAIFSSPIKPSRTTGKLIIHLHLGGVNGLTIEEIEHLRDSNDL